MIVHAMVAALVVLSASAPSGRARKPGTTSKPAVTEPQPPATEAAPSPPPGETSRPASSAEPRASEAKAAPAVKPGGLPPLDVGVTLGPAIPLGRSVAAPGGGRPIWGRLVASGTLPLTRVGPAELAVGLGLGFQRYALAGTSGTVGLGIDFFPAGRATFRLLDNLSAYGELGLGVVFYNTTYQVPFTGYQSIGSSGSGLRLGGGLSYALGDKLSIVFEPIGLLVATVTTSVTAGGQTFTATGTGSQWSFLLGATYRL
jgi:hypothetical protein